MNENLFSLDNEEIDLLKCVFCDDYIKRKFLDLREAIFRVYKNFVNLNKSYAKDYINSFYT